MKMSNDEMMKLFDFILENKDIIISDNGLFSRDTLIIIRAIVKGKISNDFVLTEDQEKVIIDAFINSNNVFNEDTPYFIKKNLSCITLSIARDINSVNFIEDVDCDLENSIIDEVLKHKFILKEKTPSFLKRNISVALNSINLDVNSANFIDWYNIGDDDEGSLVNAIIKNGYVLSCNSSRYLACNLNIVMESLKKDINNIKYAYGDVENHPLVFKYLILNDYNYLRWQIEGTTLDFISEAEVFSKCLKRLYFDDDEEYVDRYSELYCAALNKHPSIKTFDSVFQYIVDEEWEKYRKDNFNDFNNIFGKICAELKNHSDFNNALASLTIIGNIQSTLGEKYDLLYKAMTEYFDIFHSDMPNKLEKLESSKDAISKLSALYVSKSKESYKKDKLEGLYEYIRDFFTLRTENSYINKRIVQFRQKKIFKESYIVGYRDVCEFLDNILEKYGEKVGSDIAKKMMKSFVLYDVSKIEDRVHAKIK